VLGDDVGRDEGRWVLLHWNVVCESGPYDYSSLKQNCNLAWFQVRIGKLKFLFQCIIISTTDDLPYFFLIRKL
jgi:hypothetical protein